MRTRRFASSPLVAAILAVLAVGGAAAQVAIKIAPKDKLTVSVWNNGSKEADYSGEFIVDVDGTFEYPQLGRIKAAGLTSRDVELSLKDLLTKHLTGPQVTIGIEQSAQKKVTINGEVRAPATYQFAGDLSLFDALTKAGSLTEQASDEAQVIRASADGMQETIKVDLWELFNGGLKGDILLADGDRVIVRKSEPVYVSGQVNSPGQVFVKRNTTVQQALAMAGGLTDRGSQRSLKIQRMVEGKKKEIAVKDWTVDVVKPGDTIVVPARIF